MKYEIVMKHIDDDPNDKSEWVIIKANNKDDLIDELIRFAGRSGWYSEGAEW